MERDSFEVICEVEPATTPDLSSLRRQIEVMSDVATSFLIPDNHLGRACVSSIAAAHEVANMGKQATACLNARDRNLLGFQRDLLTAAAYGVDEFLFVYGDRPEVGQRVGNLTVSSMIDEAREFSKRGQMPTSFKIGASAKTATLPEWKQKADCLYAQVSFSVDELVSWRDSVEFEGPIYAGVLVVTSPAMADRLSTNLPDLRIPSSVLKTVQKNENGGVDIAFDLASEIKDSGMFDGIHLVPVNKFQAVAERFQSFSKD